ncbi:MAG: YncE family protein [Jatrophihabitans sp.]
MSGISRLGVSLAVVTAVAGLVACGSGGGKQKGPGAAEPATAPATSSAPAGTSKPVGAEPEGIVYDPTTKLVAVAVRNPDRLLLLDSLTLAVRRSVSLPGSVRHLQLGRPGGPVLVPAETANQIVQVSLPGGATRANNVQKQPHDAAEAGNGDIVVGNEFGKSISIVRGGKVVKTIADLKQPGGIIADGDTIGVVDVGAFTLSTYDLATMTRTARVSAGAGPTHGNLVSGNRMIVSDTRGGQMLVFSVDPLKRTGTLALPGAPYGMAVDATTDTVWVTLTARNEVVGLDVATDAPRVIARYPTVRQPNTVAVQPGGKRLWITGAADGVVQRIDR